MKNLILLIFLALCLNASAKSWRVNNSSAIDADFSTFNEAYLAASPGDTIYLEGTGYENHYGQLVLDKKLIIIGPGYFLNQNSNTQANPVPARVRSITINPTANGSQIYGLWVEWNASGFGGVTIKASDVIIARNYLATDRDYINIGPDNVFNVSIMQNYGWGVKTTSSPACKATNIGIANNFFNDKIELNSISMGIIINNVVKTSIHAYNSQIKNNIIFVGTSYPLGANYHADNYIAYNLVAGSFHYGSNPPSPPGPGNIQNISASDVFIDYSGSLGFSTDAKWQLNPDGIAVGAGEDGIDCGMFGGALSYVLSGLPPIPRIYEATVPTVGSTTSGLQVNFKVRSQN